MDSVLRPRDIQARIRSGESPETVAAAAQTTVDKIMGFATPVLAERAYVADQALKASVRRRAGDGPVGPLGEAVHQRLGTRGIDPDQVSWDAWRRGDGRWTLVADYPEGTSGSQARFVYDAAGRYVVAEDDAARWLVGERTAEPSAPAQPADQPAVDENPEDFEDTAQLPLGDDAIGMITGVRPDVAQQPATDDWMLTQASERAADPEQPRQVEEPAATLFDAPAPEEQAQPEQTQSEQTQSEQAQPRKSSKSKRASVPSWDEIMFGSGKNE